MNDERSNKESWVIDHVGIRLDQLRAKREIIDDKESWGLNTEIEI